MASTTIEQAAAEFVALACEIREFETELESRRQQMRQSDERRVELEKFLLAAVDSSQPVRVILVGSEEGQPALVISHPSDIRIVEVEGDRI